MSTSSFFALNEKPLGLKQRFALSRFSRGEAPIDGPIVLSQRRVFILPTQQGLAMVFTVVLLLLIAFIYNNNLVYFLAFLVASSFFVAILHTYKNLAGLSVHISSATPVFAGDLANFPMTVVNPDGESRLMIEVNSEHGLQFDLEANETKRVTVRMPTLKRGRQALDTVTLSSRFPLGVFRAWSPLRFQAEVLVYPKPSPDFKPFPVSSGDRATGVSVKAHFGTDDFNGIREYQRGDSPRQIHWKAYAKGQGLLTKQYAMDAGTELWFTLDQADGINLEQRLSRLCRWVIDAEVAGLRYGLRLPSGTVELGNGSSQQAMCLKKLAEI